MMDAIFTFVFIAIFVAVGYKLFEDDDHDEWRGW